MKDSVGTYGRMLGPSIGSADTFVNNTESLTFPDRARAKRLGGEHCDLLQDVERWMD